MTGCPEWQYNTYCRKELPVNDPLLSRAQSKSTPTWYLIQSSDRRPQKNVNSHATRTQIPPQVAVGRSDYVAWPDVKKHLIALPIDYTQFSHPTNSQDSTRWPHTINPSPPINQPMDEQRRQPYDGSTITQITLELSRRAENDLFFLNILTRGRKEGSHKNKISVRLDIEAHSLAMDDDYFRGKYRMGNEAFFVSWTKNVRSFWSPFGSFGQEEKWS